MLIEKLEWVRHVTLRNERAPIYSIDFHPDGTRFATGAGDAKVKIWSTKSLSEDSSGSEGEEEEGRGGDSRDSSAANGGAASPSEAASGLMASRMPGGSKNVGKTRDSSELLAVLASHTDPVNCVRWSSKGRFLASASDDRFIIIWEQRAAGVPSSAPFGSEAVKNVENWSQAFTLQGHTLNIMDLNWSPDDSMIASASLDNRVIIWPMRGALMGQRGVINPLIILEGHENQVKGVAWDPVGKYLATSAQDNTMLVWRTSDWAVEAKVTKPFVETAKQESLFRRISWSPDGGSICATNSSKKSRHVAALLTRGNDWACETDLVGHERPVVATRFCPVIFRKKDAASGSVKYSTMVALGDDNTGLLTIWSSTKTRPLLVIKDVFAGGTTDLTWSRDGRTLLASSLDGTVCMLSFEQGELGAGKPLGAAEMAAMFMRTYGSSGVSEGAVVLREHAMAKTAATNKTTGGGQQASSLQESPSSSSSPLPSSSGGGGGVTANWLQPRPKDGNKKRIRPQLLTGTTSTALTTTTDGSSSMPSPAAGHKRLRPMGAPPLFSSSSSTTSGPRTVVSVVVEKESVRFTVDCPYDKAGLLTRIINDFDGLGGHVDDMVVDGSASGNALGGGSRRPVTVDVTVNDQGAASLGPMSHLKVSTGGRLMWQEALPGRAKTVCGNGALVAVGCADGSVHVLGSGGLRLCPPLMVGAPVAILECTALPSPSDDDDDDDIGGVMNGDEAREGKREGLKEKGMYVMAIDQAGGVRVWDMYRMQSVVNTTIKPIFTSMALESKPATATMAPPPPPGGRPSASSTSSSSSSSLPKIMRAEVTKSGRPRVEVAMGRGAVQAFVHDAAMDTWMRVADSRYTLSDFSSSTTTSSNASMVAVSTLLREEEDKAVQRDVTRGHLEDRLASAVAAEAKEDVVYYLRLLTTRLVKSTQVGRLRALCDRLLGRSKEGDEQQQQQQEAGRVVDTEGSLAYWRPEKKWLVCGELSKKEALRDLVMPILMEAPDSPPIQRLAKQYQEALLDNNRG